MPWLYVASAMLAFLYVALALSPSSYALGLEMLGLPAEGLILGTPKAIRSDEWMVLTPYFQIAVANGLGTINELSPYQESLRTFQALPILDWGLLFKPYHWGFLVLPPAHAFSFFYMCMAASFIAGWTIFMCQLRLPVPAALLVSVTILFSPIVQGWWSSNAGVFALAPWVAVFWIGIDRRWLRVLACAYALTVWLLSCAYPPFLHALGLTMLILVLVFRRDTLSWARCSDAALASGLALAVFISYFGDLIAIMQATVYPGQRVSHSGGIPLHRMLAHLFPTITTRKFEPLPAFASNASEITVLSSLLPLCTITLLDFSALRERIRRNWLSALILLASIAFICSWLLVNDLPSWFGRYTGLYMVPPPRSILAFGLVLNLTCALLIVRCGVRLSAPRLAVMAALLLLGVWMKIQHGTNGVHGLFSFHDLVPFACLAGLLLIWKKVHTPSRMVLAVLSASLLGNLATYGLFNPVQSATPIFSLDAKAIELTMYARGADTAADGTLVVPGHYGALLAGAGLHTVNHTLYAPQMEYFRRYFPAISASDFNTIFNRYSHISVGNTPPKLLHGDHVSIPSNAFLQHKTPVHIKLNAPATRPHALVPDMPTGHIDSISQGDDNTLALNGWLRTPLNRPTEIALWTSVPYLDASLKRVARPDVASAVEPTLLHSGVDIRLTFPEEATGPVDICLSAHNQDGPETTVKFPSGESGCTRIKLQ